jgi:hypothetical protein
MRKPILSCPLMQFATQWQRGNTGHKPRATFQYGAMDDFPFRLGRHIPFPFWDQLGQNIACAYLSFYRGSTFPTQNAGESAQIYLTQWFDSPHMRRDVLPGVPPLSR